MRPDTRTPKGELSERTMTVEEVMKFSSPWILGATFLIVFVHGILHGVQPPQSVGSFLVAVALLIFAFAVSVVIHEALHVLAMLIFGRVPLRSITWGHRIREGIVYVHSTRPMTVRAYRVVLALPGVVMGIVPVIVAWATGSWLLVAYGWLMTISAVGDLASHRLIRDLEPSVLVRDHPEHVGVLVMEMPQHHDSHIEN